MSRRSGATGHGNFKLLIPEKILRGHEVALIPSDNRQETL